MANESVFVFDGNTNKTIQRELTESELQDQDEVLEELKLQKTEHELKAAARNSALAKLASLGLTEEEIAAL
jgi:Xaa-Pro aminopeptidase